MKGKAAPYPEGTLPTRQLAGLASSADVLRRHQDKVLVEFEARLETVESPLLSGSQMNDLLRAQVMTVIEYVTQLLLGEAELACRENERFSELIESIRSERRVHPSEALRAGMDLSESILSVILDERPDELSHDEFATLASVVQRSTMERAAKASTVYVDHLLARVHDSHTAERKRISRELHDRVASSLAVIHHHLQLYKTLKDQDPGRAEEKLELIRDATQDALTSSKELSTELRRSVTQEGLEVALSKLLAVVVPKNMQASISIRGDESLIPDCFKDELFLVIREAVRNATAHSGAEHMRIELTTNPHEVRASVRDNGKGFDHNDTGFVPGTGLESMEERTRLMGGVFRIVSNPETGTRVEIQVPIERCR